MAVRRLAPFVAGIVGFAFSAMSLADDVFVVRFVTPPALIEAPCTFLTYGDELVFQNNLTEPAVVRFLGNSEGGTASTPEDLTVGPRATTSSFAASAIYSWAPSAGTILWVTHLDMPPGVDLISRLLIHRFQEESCGGDPRAGFRKFVGGRMPVVRQLAAPGVPQVHLGTDLGSEEIGVQADARTNVGIYNDGETPAAATIELKRTCDGGTINSRSISVPPKSVVQVNGFGGNRVEPCNSESEFEQFVVVTVDQPSFSYAVSLSNENPPWNFVTTSP